ncbi:MAG: ImmA/IrrE family metallo-endopeptidase [Saprospiraceae bacterium]
MKHLLNLFKIQVDDFLVMISIGLKKSITEEEIFSNEIKVSYLKRIDKIFEKGLHYYLDPKAPQDSKEASIFFRKQDFNADLNIEAKRVVNHFEEFKISLSAIAKLAELEIKRTIPIYSTNHNPKKVAIEIRKILYPEFNPNLRDFLKSLIYKFAEYNVLVFEFIEYWNQNEKANIDGFFLSPNVIVVKRQQTSFRREIFTLIHELAHFLLNEEEIEQLEIEQLGRNDLTATERWCNDFAFYFLAGEYSNVIDSLENATSQNDYHHDLIKTISEKTHLSQIAIFTRLLLQNQISPYNYSKVKSDFDEKFREHQEELRRIKKLEKQQGIKRGGAAPQAIKSPLLVNTIQTAFYEGVLNEYEVCKRLNIKPDKLDKYLQ